MTATLAGALAIVRTWTRLYTARMDAEVRDGRRAEIESDLWELHEDARRSGAPPTLIAVHMLVRLLFGIRDDIRWRLDHVEAQIDILQQALWAGAAVSVLLLWVVVSALQTIEPPPRASARANMVRLVYPVRVYLAPLAGRPPPPPPPPPRPSPRR